jgi:glycosyltransferase involved in cell wall biosynthesis
LGKSYVMAKRNYHFLFASALFSGNEVFFENLRNALYGREGITASFLPIELSPKEFFARIPPVASNFSLKNALVTRSRLRSLEKRGIRFDAAFINHVTPAYFLSSFMKRVPTIFSLDVTPTLLDNYSLWYGIDSPSLPNSPFERCKHKLTRNLYSLAALLMPWSAWTKESLVRDYEADEKKISVLHPGIDLRRWNSSIKEDSSHSPRLPLRILFVGGDFIRKGGDLLLRVAELPEFEDCEFHFISRNFQGEQRRNIFVYSDVKPNSAELVGLFREADIFAIPTRADCSGLAICEAMGMGLPVISTNVGGIGELVDDGKNGFIVPVGDTNKLAEKLRHLKCCRDLRVSMGQRGRKKAELHYDIEKVVSTILCNLQRIADAPQTG